MQYSSKICEKLQKLHFSKYFPFRDHIFDEFSAPAFVAWSQFEYNIGVGLIKPSTALFYDLLDALAKMRRGDILLAQQVAKTGTCFSKATDNAFSSY